MSFLLDVALRLLGLSKMAGPPSTSTSNADYWPEDYRMKGRSTALVALVVMVVLLLFGVIATYPVI